VANVKNPSPAANIAKRGVMAFLMSVG